MRGLEARVGRHRPRGLLIALGCVLALIATGGWLVFRSDQFAVRAARSANLRLPSARPARPAERTPALEPQLVSAVAPPVQSAANSLIRKPQLSPWQRVGQCTAGVEPRSVLDRSRYFATFARLEAPDTTLFVEAGVTGEAVATVRENLTHARLSAKGQLGIDASPPLIYLYASVESLRDHACVNSSAVAYYDGAIHLAMNSPEERYIKLNRSLRHEYVHHVLITNGIDEPMWFQEGTALLIADELSWFKWHPTGRMLPTREMIHHFPQTASPEFTEAFYGQAFRMVTFLNDLCWRRGDCPFARDLVSALKNGRATPETLFDWTVAQRGTDLFATARLPLWDDYVENGFSFSTATEAARMSRFFKPR